MDRKVSRKQGRAIYKRCQQIIEPVFGQIKDVREIRVFMRRGRAAAASEWKLICGTHNLLKLRGRALVDATAAPYARYSASSSSLAWTRAASSGGLSSGGFRSIASISLTMMPPTSARRAYLWSAGTTYH